MLTIKQPRENELPGWATVLINRYCRRLTGLVEFRLDPRLRGRLGVVELVEEIERYLRRHVRRQRLTDRRSLLVWLRSTSLRLLDAIHREYLGPHYAATLQPGLLRLDCLPRVSVQQLATELAGPARGKSADDSSPPPVALQDAFNRLCPADREILAMRHFERLTRDEVATVLQFSICRASHNYLAAVRRLRCELNRQGRFVSPAAFPMVQPVALGVGYKASCTP